MSWRYGRNYGSVSWEETWAARFRRGHRWENTADPDYLRCMICDYRQDLRREREHVRPPLPGSRAGYHGGLCVESGGMS
jgi:hypothetical protein